MFTKRRQDEFLRLLAPLREDLSRFCLAMTRDPEAGRDLMSDVILAAWEGFDKLREEEAFLSFLFTIARRTYRRRWRREQIFGDYDEEAARQIAQPGRQVWIGADVRALYDALARLPEAQREAIILFELSGLSLKEVAEVQSSSLSAVKSRVTRGRERLALLLGADQENRSASADEAARHAARPAASPSALLST